MRIIDQIGTGNLFNQLSEEEVKHFSQRFKTVHVKTGEYVFKETERGDTLFIVQKGLVTI